MNIDHEIPQALRTCTHKIDGLILLPIFANTKQIFTLMQSGFMTVYFRCHQP